MSNTSTELHPVSTSPLRSAPSFCRRFTFTQDNFHSCDSQGEVSHTEDNAICFVEVNNRQGALKPIMGHQEHRDRGLESCCAGLSDNPRSSGRSDVVVSRPVVAMTRCYSDLRLRAAGLTGSTMSPLRPHYLQLFSRDQRSRSMRLIPGGHRASPLGNSGMRIP